MLKYLRLVTGFIFILTLILPVLAQTGEQLDGNWCYEGQPWGDGRCNHEDEDLQSYQWLAGWCAFAIEAELVEFETVEDCLGEEEEVIVTEDEEVKDKKKKNNEDEEEQEPECEVECPV